VVLLNTIASHTEINSSYEYIKYKENFVTLQSIGIIIKSKETGVVADTCRYSSGSNSATTTVLNLGINFPLEYPQVSATTLVSLYDPY